MSDFPKNCTAAIIPVLRYKDAPAAIEWLCQAFGFEKHVIFPNADGTIGHAQLKFGNGMIMLSSVVESEFNKFSIHPSDTGKRSTQSLYLTVNDADAVYASAKAVNAEVVRDIQDESYGGRGFTCRDLEGHLWSIGTFDCWE
jgi:uncharacterized glyoxalase superfamily protein PhnB